METMIQTIVTEGTYLFLFILLLPILFIIRKNFTSFLTSKSTPLPPGPTPWPIIGNIPHMGKKPHITLANFAQSYGPLMSLRLGTQTLVIGSSKAVAVEILKTHDRNLSARYVPYVEPAKNSKFNHLSLIWAAECNDAWKNLRTICRTELFSGKAIETQACLREKKVMEMVKFLNGEEGKVVKVGEVVFATVFNMLSNVLISIDCVVFGEESVDGGMKGLLRTIMQVAATPNLSDFYPIFGESDLQGLKKKIIELEGRISAMWKPIIEERRKRKRGNSSSEQDFLDALLDNGFTNDQINNLLLELLTAGTDTSTITIEWALAELIKNSKSMKKVREEIAREIDQYLISESRVTQLPYLQACVKETLRLHPPGPFLLPHRALDTCQVMNYTIPKNARLLVNVWAIGRDPVIWEDPLEFKPERFLNSNLDFKGNDFEFLPFGAGRRICPGVSMAAKHVPLVIASLIHYFDWSIPDGSDPSELDMNDKFDVFVQKEQPLLLTPKIRT